MDSSGEGGAAVLFPDPRSTVAVCNVLSEGEGGAGDTAGFGKMLSGALAPGVVSFFRGWMSWIQFSLSRLVSWEKAW